MFVIIFAFVPVYISDIDIVGHTKPQSLYRQVLWGVSPLEMSVHRPLPEHASNERVGGWGWPEEIQSWSWDHADLSTQNGTLNVNVYSKDLPAVTLLLNGHVVGRGIASLDNQYTVTLSVPYKSGNLTAVATGSKAQATRTLVTAGKPASLELSADRPTLRAADRNDLSYVTVQVLDTAGTLVPEASVPVTFEVQGAGELTAVGNGDPQDLSSFYTTTRHTWMGKAVAIIRPLLGNQGHGSITLIARAPGMKEAHLKLEAK